jgi:hypothetical protein
MESGMDFDHAKDWRELYAEAAEEPDSGKVASLVNQILQAVDECDQMMSATKEPHPQRDSNKYSKLIRAALPEPLTLHAPH